MKKFIMTSFYHREDEFPTKYSLAALRLGTYLSKQKDVITEILTFHIDDSVDNITASIFNADFDFLGLSSYMWTTPKVQEIINKLNLKNTDKKIIVGGPDVENISDDKNIIKIKGEGEVPLFELFSSLEHSNKEISDTTPLYGQEMFDALSINPGDLGDKFGYYETNRGCLYSCGYCGHKTREKIYGFNNLLVKEEIMNIGKLGLKEVFIVDPILGGTKGRGKDVLRLFIKYAPSTKLTIYLRPEFIDDEYVEILKKTALKELRVGIQTINDKVPTWIRSNNINQIKKGLVKLCGTDIPWRTELIAGLPGDSLEGLQKSMAFVIDDLQPTFAYTYPLSIIEGTKLYEIVDKNDQELWVKKNENNQAISSSSYTQQELKEMIKFATTINALYMHIYETKGIKLPLDELVKMSKKIPYLQSSDFLLMAEKSDYKGIKEFLSNKI